MKRHLALLLALMTCLSFCLPIQAGATDGDQGLTDSTVTDYLQLGDYLVVLPAEDQNGGIVSTTYALSSQGNGVLNGDDVHMWSLGTGVKWCVRRAYTDGTFALISTNFRESHDETASGTDYETLFWDLEGKSTKSGTNLHLWEDDDLNDDSKLFFLEDNGDGDPETFYIGSYLAWDEGSSALYLAPEGFFDGSDWDDNGVNTVLSETPFTWRVQVIDRVAQGVDPAWMAAYSDDVLLSNLNIPGTHDTGTANVHGSFNEDLNLVACQKYFIDQQLIAGIRAMDIRCEEDDGDVILSHGNFDCYHKDHGETKGKFLTLKNALQDTVDFLTAYPSETVIFVVKKEVDGDDIDEKIQKIILEYKDYLYDWSSQNPTLGDVRGKIVVMTRVPVDADSAHRNYFGPDLSKWDSKYNADKDKAQKITADSDLFPAVYVQDDYECMDSTKMSRLLSVFQQLNGEDAAALESSFVFNFSSKTLGTPLGGAEEINPFLLYNDEASAYFRGGQRTGIIMMDYADKAMAQYVIDSNQDRDLTYPPTASIFSEGSAFLAIALGVVAVAAAAGVILKKKKSTQA